MIDVEVRLQEETLEKIEWNLEKVTKDTQAALREVLDGTARQALDILAARVESVYAYRRRVQSSASIRASATGTAEAAIEFRSPVYEPKNFRVQPAQTAKNVSKTKYTAGQRDSRTVKAKVLAQSGMKALEGKTGKAFIVRFGSGHVAVVSRDPVKKMKKNPKKAALRKFLSPSVPSMVGNEKVYADRIPELNELIDRQAKQAIHKLLGG